MRLIYVDEAGTSANEPVCVVAAVIIHGDSQYREVQSAMNDVICEHVPKNLQENFNIHATEIYSGGKKIKRDEWAFDERLDFLKAIACIPLVYDIPIAIGVEVKNSLHVEFAEKLNSHEKRKYKFTADSVAHILAFMACMERADLFLRQYLYGSEIGTVIAEDVESMRSILSNSGLWHRTSNFVLSAEEQTLDIFQKEFGLKPVDIAYKIEHIIDTPHFVKKGKAPLLQLADVVAFSLRHFLSNKPNGRDLVLATLGPLEGLAFVNDEAWLTGPSLGLFNTFKYWPDDRKKLGIPNQYIDLLLRKEAEHLSNNDPVK